MIDRILQREGLDTPDGRPLHGYAVDDADRLAMRDLLSAALARGNVGGRIPAIFVLWAADRVRTSYEGGIFRWQFVFDGIGRPADQALASELVTQGLHWWRRAVRLSATGRSFFLYSLLAEGGIPDRLLVDQESHYRRSVTGLMTEIEKLRAVDDEGMWSALAVHWTDGLPQAFHNKEFVELLAQLAGRIARLRARLPPDLPVEAATAWLDARAPDWMNELPLRPTSEAARALLKGVMQADRGSDVVQVGTIAARELLRDPAGVWSEHLRLEPSGQIPAVLLRESAGLRLRMVPTGQSSAAPYSATPTDAGWDLRRLGGSPKSLLLPLDLARSFGFAAYADGLPRGEIEILPGLRLEEESYALWREAGEAAGIPGGEGSGDDFLRLDLVPGAAKVRQAALWILTPPATQVLAGEGLELSDPEPCAGSSIRKVAGKGILEVGGERVAVAAASESEAPAARLAVTGAVLPGWRTVDHDLVWLGEPLFVGMRDGEPWRMLTARNVEINAVRRGRVGERICAWSERGEGGTELVARLRFVSLPGNIRIRLVEPEEGEIALDIDGLQAGLGFRLVAGTEVDIARSTGEGVSLGLTVPGVPPGEVELQFHRDGSRPLRLVAPWPARSGMVLSPEGRRLTGGLPIAVDDLRGWRLFAPDHSDLQFNLAGLGHRVSLKVAGEVPLVAYLPLIRAILAQGDPDAQVNLKLIVGGRETTRRLEVRRYADAAGIVAGRALFGLDRNLVWSELGRLAGGGSGMLSVHAVDLLDPLTTVDRDMPIEGSLDLAGLLASADLDPPGSSAIPEVQDAEPGGAVAPDVDVPHGARLWLIQTSLDGRCQRALAWSAAPIPTSTREGRIARYADRFRAIMADPAAPDWNRFATLFRYVARHGDLAVLYEVQALVDTPEAAVAFLLARTPAELPDVLGLDLASPLFWPIVPVDAVEKALVFEHRRQIARYGKVFEPDEAEQTAEATVARSIGAVLRLRPELAGHMAVSLKRIGLPPFALQDDAPVPLIRQNPARALADEANGAAQRQDRLPNGLGGLRPRALRPALPAFASFVQPVIEAPLVAAEVALGLSPPLSAVNRLRLVNLRFVDPIYFDAALPLAIQYGASR